MQGSIGQLGGRRTAGHATVGRFFVPLPALRTGNLLGSSDSLSASETIYRTFAGFTGTGAVFFGLILFPEIRSQSNALDGWFTPISVLIVFLPLFLLIPASLLRDIVWIGRVGTLAAITWLAAAITWLFVLNTGRISPQDDVWLATFPALAAMATAFTWPVWLTVAYLVVSSSVAQFLHYVTRGGQESAHLLPEIAFITMFCSLFVGAIVVALRAGPLLDAAIADARAQAAVAASAEAKDLERKRFDSFVHDHVMSTLLALAREGNSPELSVKARDAVTEMRSAAGDTWSGPPITMAAAMSSISEAARQVSADAAVFVDIEDDARSELLPADVSRALCVAAAEAMHNSVVHAKRAGGRVDRIVDLVANQAGITVVVADNGSGFDLNRIPPDRLGITVSILGQLRALSGCSAAVETRQGFGTSVALSWRRT